MHVEFAPLPFLQGEDSISYFRTTTSRVTKSAWHADSSVLQIFQVMLKQSPFHNSGYSEENVCSIRMEQALNTPIRISMCSMQQPQRRSPEMAVMVRVTFSCLPASLHMLTL